MLPAEAGLEERAISFTKGCYPGQEPVARLHYRGHPNRGLRVLALEGDELPAYDAELTLDGKAVGRITSAVADGGRVLALAYVRREVAGRRGAPPGLPRGDAATLSLPAPVAQGIERCPAEAEVARSNRAGRTRKDAPRRRCPRSRDAAGGLAGHGGDDRLHQYTPDDR